MLWDSVTPVRACSGGPLDVHAAREVIINEIDMVVIGAIAEPRVEHAQIEIETVYRGPSLNRVTLTQSSDLPRQYPQLAPPRHDVASSYALSRRSCLNIISGIFRNLKYRFYQTNLICQLAF